MSMLLLKALEFYAGTMGKYMRGIAREGRTFRPRENGKFGHC